MPAPDTSTTYELDVVSTRREYGLVCAPYTSGRAYSEAQGGTGPSIPTPNQTNEEK